MARTSRVDWVLFFVLGAIWGSSFLFIKIGVESLGPFTLVTLRVTFATLLLAAVIRLARQSLPRDRVVYRDLAILAVINIVIPFSLITWGERSIESALASILNATMPLFTIVIAGLALREEPITLNRLVGLIVGFGGVVLLVSGDLGSSGQQNQLTGELAVALAAASYACGAVFTRHRMRGIRPMVVAAGQVWMSLPIMALLALLFEHPWTTDLRPEALFAVIWLGVLGSGIAYLISFRLIARWDATRASLVTYLLPAVGIVLGVVFLSEHVDARVLLGTVLIVGGVALVNSRFGTRRLYGRAPAAVAPEASGVEH